MRCPNALVICPKLPPQVPALFEQNVPGFAQWGVLVRLSASNRISRLYRSLMVKLRNTLKSSCLRPGPLIQERPRLVLPMTPGVTTGVKEAGANQNWPGPVFLGICNDPVKLGVLLEKGAFKKLDVANCNGAPV